jgi:glucan phosphoethanolaminetransferase (alkaline phosphatase superfamily)
MKAFIEHLNNPLVLIGFMIFIFSGFIKIFLKNNTIHNKESSKIINKYLNYVFILALAGMAFGFFSQKNPSSGTIIQGTSGEDARTEISNVDVDNKNIYQHTIGNGASTIIRGR